MTQTQSSSSLFSACLHLLHVFVISSAFAGFCMLLDVALIQGVLVGRLPTRGPVAFAIFTGVAGTHIAVTIFSSVAFVRALTMPVRKRKEEMAPCGNSDQSEPGSCCSCSQSSS